MKAPAHARPDEYPEDDSDPAMRGYDRAQVDNYLATIDAELRATTGERDAIAARSADIAAQLASSHAQVAGVSRFHEP